MRLDKKGIGFGTLIAIIITTLVFFFMLGLFNYLSAEINDDVSEQLCRASNALRIGTAMSGDVRLAPRGCKIIDKTVPDAEHVRDALIPTTGSNADVKKYAAMQHVADLAARCWWMWLEGIEFTDKNGKPQKNVLDPNLFISEKKCFICYDFVIKEPTSFTTQNLIDFMDTSFYKVKDTSDQCSIVGGVCKTDCTVKNDIVDKDNKFTQEVPDSCNQIKPGTKCCVADKKFDCVNRGGSCSFGGVFEKPFNGWTCRDRDKHPLCYLSANNYFSYTKYLQEFNGRGGFYSKASNGFKSDLNQHYAIVFSEETEATLSSSGGGIDNIIIAPLETVNKDCSVDWGVSEK